MSEHAATTSHTSKRPPGAAPAESSYGSLLEGNRQAFERWFRSTWELSHEMLQFTQARLQEDAAAWAQLATLRNVDEALRFQQRFAERAAKEYLEEFNRLSRIMGGMSAETPVPTRRPQA